MPHIQCLSANFIICNPQNVIYVLTRSEYQLQYVGHTSNALQIRIRRHLQMRNNRRAGNTSAPTKHFSQGHQGEASAFSFVGLEKVSCPSRGGDIKRRSLAREVFWICTPGARVRAGLSIRQVILYQY